MPKYEQNTEHVLHGKSPKAVLTFASYHRTKQLLVSKTQLQKAIAGRGFCLSSVSFLLWQPGVLERPFVSAAVHQRSLAQEGTVATHIPVECLASNLSIYTNSLLKTLRVKSPYFLKQAGSRSMCWLVALIHLTEAIALRVYPSSKLEQYFIGMVTWMPRKTAINF